MTTWIIIIAVFAAAFFFLIRIIRGSQKKNSPLENPTVILNAENEILSPEALKRLVGRVGIAQSYMIPYGKVKFDSLLVEAIAEQPPIKRGETVRVIRIDGSRVVVIPANISVIAVN